MRQLASLQINILDHIKTLRSSINDTPPNFLVYGLPGSGKKTTVRAFAEFKGLDFIEVNVSGTEKFVRQLLFGDLLEAKIEKNIGLCCTPGECGDKENILLYLSGFERLNPELHGEFHQLIKRRRYKDALGNYRCLSDKTWLVGALSIKNDCDAINFLNIDHWLAVSFDHSVEVDILKDEESFWEICQFISKEYGKTFEGKKDEMLFSGISKSPGRLHALRRWISAASVHSISKEIIEYECLKKEMWDDIRNLLNKLIYRGYVTSMETFNKWAEQFGDKKIFAISVIRWIANAYYIDVKAYFNGIKHIIGRFKIPRNTTVIFCEWQAKGRSAPRLAHQIKNQAFWKTDDKCQVNLLCGSNLLNGLNPQKEYHLIIVDDFCGSGDTLNDLFSGDNSPVRILLEKLPKAKLYIGIIVGYRDAFQKLNRSISPYGSRIKLVPYRVFDEKDKCFSKDSQIFPDLVEREAFKDFCITMANKHFRSLKDGNKLGFKDIGSLVVFADTVPNNSLPILWYNSSSWISIFPASGLPETSVSI